MKTIYKYALPIQNEVTLEVPGHGQVLLVDEQHGSLTLWMEVDTDAPLKSRTFRIRGTGHPLGKSEGDFHVGSAKVGEFVWHVYSRNI
jgi:hypothetical protein